MSNNSLGAEITRKYIEAHANPKTPVIPWPRRPSATAEIGTLGALMPAEVPDCPRCPLENSCKGYGLLEEKPPCLLSDGYTIDDEDPAE